MNKVVIVFLSVLLILTGAASDASSNAKSPKKVVWPFEGIFGTFDRRAAQRGMQVYLEVCGVCHGMHHLYYRNLKDLGFSEAEIKAIAKEKNIIDGPNDIGEMFERPALPSDKFALPYPNEQAARAANNGAYPVDLSLVVKAREDGANYLFSLLTGYADTPDNMSIMPGLYYNPYFEGMQVAMPPPLIEGVVSYADGTIATVEQMARDVTIFLQWAAEPEMEHRKSLGLKVMIFLVVFTVFFIISKRRIWSDVNSGN